MTTNSLDGAKTVNLKDLANAQDGRRSDRIPSKVRLCGHDVVVAFPTQDMADWDANDRQLAGCVLQYCDLILLSGEGQHGVELPAASQEETFLHEVIHYLEQHYGFELKENDVIRLASGLYQLLADNDIYFFNRKKDPNVMTIDEFHQMVERQER